MQAFLAELNHIALGIAQHSSLVVVCFVNITLELCLIEELVDSFRIQVGIQTALLLRDCPIHLPLQLALSATRAVVFREW